MRFFNRLVLLGLAFDTIRQTATSASGAVTHNKRNGVITTEALTTAAAAVFTLTLTNSEITANDMVFVSLGNGTNTQGVPVLNTVTPGAGSVVIKVSNEHASQAFNGTLKISYFVVKTRV